jgi:hypothetical protein
MIWIIAGVLLVVALYLYFRFGRETPAVLHGMLS